MRILTLHDALGVLILQYLDMSPKVVARSLQLNLDDTYDLMSERDLGRKRIQIHSLSFRADQIEKYFQVPKGRGWTLYGSSLKKILEIYVDAQGKQRIEDQIDLGPDGHQIAVNQMCEWVSHHHQECNLHVRGTRRDGSYTSTDSYSSPSRDDRSLYNRIDRSYASQYRTSYDRPLSERVDPRIVSRFNSKFEASRADSTSSYPSQDVRRVSTAPVSKPIPQATGQHYMSSPRTVDREPPNITSRQCATTTVGRFSTVTTCVELSSNPIQFTMDDGDVTKPINSPSNIDRRPGLQDETCQAQNDVPQERELEHMQVNSAEAIPCLEPHTGGVERLDLLKEGSEASYEPSEISESDGSALEDLDTELKELFSSSEDDTPLQTIVNKLNKTLPSFKKRADETDKTSKKTAPSGVIDQKCDHCRKRKFINKAARHNHMKYDCPKNPGTEKNKKMRRDQRAANKLKRKSADLSSLAVDPEADVALATALRPDQVKNSVRYHQCDYCSTKMFASEAQRITHMKVHCDKNPNSEASLAAKRDAAKKETSGLGVSEDFVLPDSDEEENAKKESSKRQSANKRSIPLAFTKEQPVVAAKSRKTSLVVSPGIEQTRKPLVSTPEDRTSPVSTRSKATPKVPSLSTQRKQLESPTSTSRPATTNPNIKRKTTAPAIPAVPPTTLSKQQWESLAVLLKIPAKKIEDTRLRIEKHIDVQCHFNLQNSHRRRLDLLLTFVEKDPTEDNKSILKDLILLYCKEGKKEDWQRRIYDYLGRYGDESWGILLNRFLSL